MKRIAMLMILVLLTALPAFAAELKIGYVDLQKALNLSKAGEQAKNKIAAKVKGYEAELDGRQEELKKLKDDLEKQSLLLSPEALSSKERDYQQRLKEFQRYTKDIQEELQQQDADFTRAIIEEIGKVIAQVGKKEGFTMIFEQSESAVLYADDKVDLTQKIIDAYDATH